jgi:hypothetical protein
MWSTEKGRIEDTDDDNDEKITPLPPTVYHLFVFVFCLRDFLDYVCFNQLHIEIALQQAAVGRLGISHLLEIVFNLRVVSLLVHVILLL